MGAMLTATDEPAVIDGVLTPEAVVRVARGSGVRLDPAAMARVAENRHALDAAIASGRAIYGVTTGFGALVEASVPAELSRQLQVNLVRSHAAGTGDPLPVEIVRAALAVRLNSLIKAHSGVRTVVLERVAGMLNRGFTPHVPSIGSLGASGDLAPSAHAVLPLLGEGEVVTPMGTVISGAEALQMLGEAPLQLEAKEGLALINGTNFMAGIGALLVVWMAELLDTADLAAAMSTDALSGCMAAFDPRVHALRRLAGQAITAANVRAALAGSKRVQAGSSQHGNQDPYCLRCVPQVHGAAREVLSFARRLVQVDLEAVSDNPIVFTSPLEVISAGNFHGQSLSVAFDCLRLAIADLASISERRVFRLVSPSLNRNLPPFLAKAPGLESGYMVVQYTAAALLAELRSLAHPVSVDNVPTSDNQEDHVSMGMTSALMAYKALDRLETVLAIEVLCATRALDLVPAPEPGLGATLAARAVHEMIPDVVDERAPHADIQVVKAIVSSGAIASLMDGVSARAAGDA